MRNPPHPRASRSFNVGLVAAAAIGTFLPLEIYLAKLLDDHIAAVTITLTAAVIVVAQMATYFTGRRR